MLRKLWRHFGPNPFDRLLKKAKEEEKKRFLIVWNRGLGDIPLGLYALVLRIRHFIPDAAVAFLTRKDLADGFLFLKDVNVFVNPEWKRGQPFDIVESLKVCGLSHDDFDLLVEKPDPTRWLTWQLGKLIPRLHWREEWDALSQRFGIEKGAVGVHVQTETVYAYEKNWPLKQWHDLFIKITQERKQKVILFGFNPHPDFDIPGVIDLRGKTSLFEMLSLIKNRCSHLVVPDSGVLSMIYYIDSSFPLQVVSLWADAKQGILRQNVPSPNPLLAHDPLRGKEENIASIAVEDVFCILK